MAGPVAPPPAVPHRPAHPGWAVLIGALALAAAWLAHERAPALIGMRVDDGEYVAYARALLAGQGYVDMIGPLAEPARRFPIGFPALLALAMAGAPDWAARAAWVAPIALVAFTGLTWLAFARWTTWPAWARAGATATIALHPQALFLGSVVLSDVPAAALTLGGLLLADRAHARARVGFAAGLVLGLACLVRYAAAAPALAALAALALGRVARPPDPPGHAKRAAAALALGLATPLVPWLAYRQLAGGGRYAMETAHYLGQLDGAGTLLAGWRFLSTGLGAFAVPPAYGPAGFGEAYGVAAIATLAMLLGAARMAREATRAVPGLALLASAALTLAWLLPYHPTEYTLASRLLLPVAPIGLIALTHGWSFRFIAPQALSRAVAAALVVPLGGVAAGLWEGPTVPPALVRAVAADHAPLFQTIAARVPPEATLVASFPAMLWLYTGRHAIGYPADADALLALLTAGRADGIVATPKLLASRDDVAISLNPLLARTPAPLTLVWRNARGDYALLAPARRAAPAPGASPPRGPARP